MEPFFHYKNMWAQRERETDGLNQRMLSPVLFTSLDLYERPWWAPMSIQIRVWKICFREMKVSGADATTTSNSKGTSSLKKRSFGSSWFQGEGKGWWCLAPPSPPYCHLMKVFSYFLRKWDRSLRLMKKPLQETAALSWLVEILCLLAARIQEVSFLICFAAGLALALKTKFHYNEHWHF